MIDDFIALYNQNSFVQYYVAAVLMLWPMGRIFKRAGFSAFYALLLAVPMAGHIVCAGVLTFRRWPILPVRVRKKRKEAAA